MVRSFKSTISVVVTDEVSRRLDKALAQLIPEEFNVSRSRAKELIISGAVTNSKGRVLKDPAVKPALGQKIIIVLPDVVNSEILAEKIKLDILYEDSDLLVVDKPAGMVVHPAPGSLRGTLVNAILYHCGPSLLGIGGVKRPGIVHRLDKDTSGLLVVAKTEQAHKGLSKQFFTHSVERKYAALVYGRPSKLDKRLNSLHSLNFESENVIKICGRIARHKKDRKKMAIYKDIGRHAITNVEIKTSFGSEHNPIASLLVCSLETGRTHQIRAHLNYIGNNLIGDQTYKPRKTFNIKCSPEIKDCINGLKRQALHAKSLGFLHPRTAEWLSFTSDLPDDIQQLFNKLEKF